MTRQQSVTGLVPIGLAAALVMAGEARAGQTVDERPRIEAGARVVALAQPENPGAGGGAHVTWNLDPRTAIEGSVDFRASVSTPSLNVTTQMGYVQLKRTLYTSGTGRFYGTLGAGGGFERREYPGFTYTFSGRTVTIPATSSRYRLGGPSLGVGYDRILSAHVAFDVQTQFVITADRPIVRTLLGVSVPIGRFTPRRERATPTLAAFSQVEVGQTAWVTMADGRLWSGTVAAMSTTTIDLARAGVLTSLPLADVRKVEAPDRITDGTKRGAIIGLAAGIPALIGGLAICGNESRDCQGWALATGVLWSGIGSGIGALIGAIADSFHEGRRVVYEAGRSSLTLAPIVSRRSAGLGGVIRW